MYRPWRRGGHAGGAQRAGGGAGRRGGGGESAPPVWLARYSSGGAMLLGGARKTHLPGARVGGGCTGHATAVNTSGRSREARAAHGGQRKSAPRELLTVFLRRVAGAVRGFLRHQSDKGARPRPLACMATRATREGLPRPWKVRAGRGGGRKTAPPELLARFFAAAPARSGSACGPRGDRGCRPRALGPGAAGATRERLRGQCEARAGRGAGQKTRASRSAGAVFLAAPSALGRSRAAAARPSRARACTAVV